MYSFWRPFVFDLRELGPFFRRISNFRSAREFHGFTHFKADQENNENVRASRGEGSLYVRFKEAAYRMFINDRAGLIYCFHGSLEIPFFFSLQNSHNFWKNAGQLMVSKHFKLQFVFVDLTECIFNAFRFLLHYCVQALALILVLPSLRAHLHMAKNLVANIRRKFVDKEFSNLLYFFAKLHFLVKFLGLLVGSRILCIFLKKNLGWKKIIRRIFVEYSSPNSSPCVDGPLHSYD